MLVIRGINVYPRAIETILMDDERLGPNYAIIVDRRATLPELEARVELADVSLAGTKDEIADHLAQTLKETVRLRVQVSVGDPGSVPRSEVGKARRVFERTTDQDPLRP